MDGGPNSDGPYLNGGGGPMCGIISAQVGGPLRRLSYPAPLMPRPLGRPTFSLVASIPGFGLSIAVWYGMVWYGMVWYGMVWHGMAWHGMAWHGTAWHGTYGVVFIYSTPVYILHSTPL